MSEPRVGFSTFNGLVPHRSPRVLRVSLDFSVTIASIMLDLQEEMLTAQLEFVQTLYLDNAANANGLTVVVGATQQIIKIKANTQGYFPVLAPETAGFQFLTTAAAISVPVHFINVPMPAYSWLTQ